MMLEMTSSGSLLEFERIVDIWQTIFHHLVFSMGLCLAMTMRDSFLLTGTILGICSFHQILESAPSSWIKCDQMITLPTFPLRSRDRVVPTRTLHTNTESVVPLFLDGLRCSACTSKNSLDHT
ncbi:hypothetical protein ES702_00227 [subsurface metagenome]